MKSHTGLLVKDLSNDRVIFSHKSDHYFTPASNTKLLTFYTSLSILGDRIKGLKVYENPDSVIIWGTGDASFLNPFIQENDFISAYLKEKEKTIYLSTSNFQDEHYGSGWSWDDFNYAYQADKSALPMYGNFVNFTKPLPSSPFKVHPPYFEKLSIPNLNSQSSTIRRAEEENLFYYDFYKVKKTYKINRYVPYLSSDEIQRALLEDHIGRKVTLISSQKHIDEAYELETVEVDSLYRLLLQPSDNFVAEQLLLNCSSELYDTMNTSKLIQWAKDSLFAEMPNKYQWVDGSGLSRYNMTTPANMVHVLKLIHAKIDQDRLFDLLPTGGESGTIRRLYRADKPFIHAKTGSLRNNHSLSGYLIGDSGKVYVFSFMNSNYIVSNTELKQGMDKVLRILKKNL